MRCPARARSLTATRSPGTGALFTLIRGDWTTPDAGIYRTRQG